MGSIGIVIVTYNSEAEIGSCLDAAAGTGAEIVVVDNASADGTCEIVRKRGVRLIANSENRGFACAVNQGVRALPVPFVLLLNPDAVILTSLEPLRDACQNPGTAAAGGLLIDSAGRPQTGFVLRRLPTPWVLAFEALLINRLWPGNPVNWNYRCFDVDLAAPAKVEQPAGAFLMIRRDAWNELGGFDESFFPLWFEDVDFCKRLRDAGKAVRYTPLAVAKHTGAHSIRKISVEIRQLCWYGSVLKYAAKHFSPARRRGVCVAVMVGSLLRMAVGVVSRRERTPVAVYGRIVRLAARYFAARQSEVEVLSKASVA